MHSFIQQSELVSAPLWLPTPHYLGHDWGEYLVVRTFEMSWNHFDGTLHLSNCHVTKCQHLANPNPLMCLVIDDWSPKIVMLRASIGFVKEMCLDSWHEYFFYTRANVCLNLCNLLNGQTRPATFIRRISKANVLIFRLNSSIPSAPHKGQKVKELLFLQSAHAAVFFFAILNRNSILHEIDVGICVSQRDGTT